MAISTPKDYWDAMQEERRKAFEPRATDGPILKWLKALLGLRFFHGWIESYTKKRLIKSNTISIPMGEGAARDEFNKAVERYWIWWTIGLIVIYTASWAACTFRPRREDWAWLWFVLGVVLVLPAAIALFRILEILAVSFWLHLLGPYKTRTPAHAMVLTFLGYFHAMIGFSVLFLAESSLMGDPFKSCPGLWAHPADAFYFSAVTITTVGYGDLSPERTPGKLMAVMELFVGLILVVVAFQRAIGGFDFSTRRRRSAIRPRRPPIRRPTAMRARRRRER
jgi:voltage-gated potassium channel Kch